MTKDRLPTTKMDLSEKDIASGYCTSTQTNTMDAHLALRFGAMPSKTHALAQTKGIHKIHIIAKTLLEEPKVAWRGAVQSDEVVQGVQNQSDMRSC